MRLSVTGTVFSGMGKGKYYVGHPEYQRRFRERLGYSPYPGTLNVKLEDGALIRKLEEIRKADGVKIEGFTLGGESFSSLTCFEGELRGEKVTLLFIDITYYNETVAELVSPAYLRGKLGLKDGEYVTFSVDVPTPRQGRP
ncbi:MAG: CTP-dependent riboflavin kinase [Nitrososphaerota archaeon]|nr:CTP-dependent riboflavin kinase [Nitrososphaerota archaeon]MDG6952996.1 CTP-dependent riboflavin kinase [Nitrososphaerota archaeon]MDG6956233.1 CTP-dependent riboflavin kinase [Nitrososphaerota archaeon]MDG6957254.1 CTP-dependent riboflavin kinase [Nitrososphaerota archaeon]MDG6959901.1 CTP-dependent riboflavin kinase [Nitrososphaerota archaeon]